MVAERRRKRRREAACVFTRVHAAQAADRGRPGRKAEGTDEIILRLMPRDDPSVSAADLNPEREQIT